ncbi:ABC transporter permease [Clostridium sp. 'White wine YQ']|uniref:ABC transporter permease n=1 Tax=Clostridium sp. 'White wine YQ' TaxID=3027474 RepID=UPI0023655CF7|nr:ABC transporter permease [Clostridium sp. 'White wine YQ']MDD7794210.1 ABC transporter permease [Clostridium sp. 'White wine YQ']
MLKLMKLELKKFRIGVKGAVIANLIMLAAIVMTVFVSQDSKEFSSYSLVFELTGLTVRAVFLIFAASIIAKLVVGEYNNKTINLMFMYPINRMKIMLSKILIVLIFAFVAMLASNIFLNVSIYIINSFTHILQDTLTSDMISKTLINSVLYSFIFAFVSLIPVFVGMRRRTTGSTIITSVIVTSILSNGSSSPLSSIILIPIIFAILGVVGTYISIRNIDSVDIV